MLIILDRDGVINEESRQYIKSPDEWKPIPGSLEAIANLKKAGFQVVVATNQSGIARGLYSQTTLEKIHQKMIDSLKQWGAILDGIFFCPHHPNDKCLCRKPEPGLFLAIRQQLGANSRDQLAIGDSLSDIHAAMKLNIQPILVLTGNGKKTLKTLKQEQVLIYQDLAAAAQAIIIRHALSK
jgi:D-glycero-D-manno-heptose 1,7-bisphosphate phosphatase